MQGQLPVCGLYIESGIWNILWHRIAQMLQVRSADSDMPLHDIEGEEQQQVATPSYQTPDWGLLSFQGLMSALQLAVSVFTKVGAIANLAML